MQETWIRILHLASQVLCAPIKNIVDASQTGAEL